MIWYLSHSYHFAPSLIYSWSERLGKSHFFFFHPVSLKSISSLFWYFGLGLIMFDTCSHSSWLVLYFLPSLCAFPDLLACVLCRFLASLCPCPYSQMLRGFEFFIYWAGIACFTGCSAHLLALRSLPVSHPRVIVRALVDEFLLLYSLIAIQAFNCLCAPLI